MSSPNDQLKLEDATCSVVERKIRSDIIDLIDYGIYHKLQFSTKSVVSKHAYHPFHTMSENTTVSIKRTLYEII